MKKQIIIITGGSGVGKTTIAGRLVESNQKFVKPITATTREKRKDEVDGKDYFFLSIEDFKKKIEEKFFLEYEEVYSGKFYGVPKFELDRIWKDGKIPVLVIDVMGAQTLAAIYDRNAYVINITYPSIDIAYERIFKRDETVDLERLHKIHAEEMFGEIIQTVKVINDDLEIATQEVIHHANSFIFLSQMENI